MTHKTITLAAVLSIGFHLVVLLPVVYHQQSIIIDSPTRPVTRVAIIVSAAQTPAAAKQTTQAQKPVSASTTKQKPLPTQLAKAKPAHPAETPLNEKDEARPEQQARPADSEQRIDHDMLEYLHSEFQLRFRYPMLARKRGWSGEVVIALNVNHHGMIDHIAIQKSSGYPLLDDNAVDTFRAIGMVAPAIRSRINDTHHLSIPVIYRLTGG